MCLTAVSEVLALASFGVRKAGMQLLRPHVSRQEWERNYRNMQP
jgi:hypothetical protein